MRMVQMVAVCLVFAFISTSYASADEKYYLNADGVTVETRVSKVEERVASESAVNAQMRLRLTELEKQVAALSGKAPLASVAGPVASPTAAKKQRITFQTCVGNKCYPGECDDLSKVPANATNVTIWSGDATAATVGFADAGVMISDASAGGGGRERWHLGKNLGRSKGGNCSTCAGCR